MLKIWYCKIIYIRRQGDTFTTAHTGHRSYSIKGSPNYLPLFLRWGMIFRSPDSHQKYQPTTLLFGRKSNNLNSFCFQLNNALIFV